MAPAFPALERLVTFDHFETAAAEAPGFAWTPFVISSSTITEPVPEAAESVVESPVVAPATPAPPAQPLAEPVVQKPVEKKESDWTAAGPKKNYCQPAAAVAMYEAAKAALKQKKASKQPVAQPAANLV